MNNTKLLLAAATLLSTTVGCGDPLATENYRGDPLLTLHGTLDRNQALNEARHDVAALFLHRVCTAIPGFDQCDESIPTTLRTTVVVGRTTDGFPQEFDIDFGNNVDRAALQVEVDPARTEDPANDDEIARSARGLLVSGSAEALAQIPAVLSLDETIVLPNGVDLQAIGVVYRENYLSDRNGFSILDARPRLPFIRQASCIRTNAPDTGDDLTGATAAREQQCLDAHTEAFACLDPCASEADIDACVDACPTAVETVSPCITETCGSQTLENSVDCRFVALEEFFGGTCPYPVGADSAAAIAKEERPTLLDVRRADAVTDLADDVLRLDIDSLPLVVEQP